MNDVGYKYDEFDVNQRTVWWLEQTVSIQLVPFRLSRDEGGIFSEYPAPPMSSKIVSSKK